MSKRGKTNFNFLLGIDKPVGVSSHDVVNCVRRAFGEGRVGHMGTLDPLASGVLLIGVGSANRLNQFFAGHRKTYEVVARFGASTNTYDCEGSIEECCEPSSKLLDEKFASEILANLLGEQTQTPPVFSAIKIKGKAAYKYARSNQSVEIPKRKVTVYNALLLGIKETDTTEISLTMNERGVQDCKSQLPYKFIEWKFEVEVSGGTYIRSLVHNLGKFVDCPAHVSFLRRTSVECVDTDECIKLEELKTSAQNFTPNEFAKSVRKIDFTRLLKFEKIEVPNEKLTKIKNGQALDISCFAQGYAKEDSKFSKIILTHKNKAVAIYEVNKVKSSCNKDSKSSFKIFAKPVVVFNGEVDLGDKSSNCLKGSVCTFGVFDGVHEGHKYQIETAIKRAKSKGAKSAVITFDMDPDEFFVKDFCKLMTNSERIKALQNSGADYVEILPFAEVKDKEPIDFLDDYLGHENTPCELHIGKNFHFGKKASGDTNTLIEWGKKNGMKVFVHDLITKNGITVSSTNIRKGIL